MLQFNGLDGVLLVEDADHDHQPRPGERDLRAVHPLERDQRERHDEHADGDDLHERDSTQSRRHPGRAREQLPPWPREESNLRTRIRSPPLYPLSYGARRESRRRPRGILDRGAGVAELEDAAGLGPAGRKPLEVRVLSPASGGNASATGAVMIPEREGGEYPTRLRRQSGPNSPAERPDRAGRDLR